MAPVLPHYYYLKGAGKKSRRKTKASRTENTLATQSKGVDHFILIKIIALIRDEKNAPDDKLEFLLQDLAENGIRHDAVYFHLRFNNGETLNKKELIKMLQQGRVRFIEPEIHHILNALDDIVVKVKDIDSKTEIEYLELLYSPQNMAVYFNIEKSFNELKLKSHKINLGILLHRTLLEYFMFVIEELEKLLKIDIEQMVSVDTQRAHKASERLYIAPDKKSWHGFPVQQQASFEAAIGNEILQDADSKGKLVLSSTLEQYLKRKNMWRNSIFTAAKRAKNRVNIKKLMKPFQDIDEDFPPFVPEDITESLSDLYDKTKEMNDLNKFLVQAATTRLNYQKALELKKNFDIQLDKIKEVKDKLAGELITVITHNGEDLDTLIRINNAKKRLEEGEKKVATHEAKEMEYSIDDLKLTDNERDFLEPKYRDELTVNDHERDNWNRSSLSPFRKQRARANAYAKSWENTKYDSRPPITPTNTPPTPTNTPPSSSEDEDEEDESKGWEESKNESTGGGPYALSYYLKGAGKKSKQRKTKTTMSKEFEHSLLVRIVNLSTESEIISFTLQFNNDDKFSDNQLKNILKKEKGKFSEAETQELLNALKYLKEAVKDIDSKTQIEHIRIFYWPITIARITEIKQNISDIEPFVPKNNIKVFEDRVMLEYIKIFKAISVAHLDEVIRDTPDWSEKPKNISEFEQFLKSGNQFKDFVASISENALNTLNIEKLMQPFKDTLNFPTSLPKDIEESVLDLHERLKNISDFDEINAIELEWKSKFREHLKLKQETDSKLNTLIENKDELRGQLVTVTTHNGEGIHSLKKREYNKKNPEMESKAKIEKINSQTKKERLKQKEMVEKGQERRKEMQAKLPQMMEESVTLLGDKLPPSLRNENAGKNYRNILNATLRKPDGQDFELDKTTQIDSENKQLKSYAVTWAKDEETLQKLVNLLEDFNYITNNKPIHNKFGQQTLETLYRVYDVIDSPEKYSKRQINNISEDVTNIRNALWPNDIELWQTYDNIKKIYNSFRNYLLRNGWRLKPSVLGDTILATPAPNYEIYGSKTENDPFSNTEYKLLMELVDRFSILLPENEILINERRFEMQKHMQMQNTTLSENELDKMIKETDYMTSILKGILELPSDKNKWEPSKLQKWKILDIHERLSIDLEKLLEEEKKRVVENIKIQLGEGQEWVKTVELSAEDMDNFLNIDQFKEKEDEKIKSIISPIIDELLKETSTNSDYLNEIIDEARTEEIQQGDYYDSEDEYEVEPLWKLRKFIWDSDDDSEDDND